MTFRILVTLLFCYFTTSPALAQDKAALQSDMQAALTNNDLHEALAKADALYDLTVSRNDAIGAGQAAFSKAKILTAMGKNLEAAEAYDTCRNHYHNTKAVAQSLHCQFESAQSYLTAHKPGLGLKTLESTEKKLRDIGQDKSGMAALVYLKLSEESLPAKLDRSNRARTKRKDSVRYADKAMTALRASKQEKSAYYLSALLSKGIAHEDLENFDEASLAFEEAIKLHAKIPDSPKEILENAKTRLSITKHYAKSKNDKQTISVTDNAGKKILLRIKRKKRVKYPRINKNQMVDGARAQAKITLNEDGSVATLEIVESFPKKEFGEALANAVKTWKFIPPEGMTGLDVPEFTYSMVFFVKRM